MTGSLVLVGGGGHAKVVFDAAICAGHTVAGFLDDHPDAALASLGVTRLGSLHEWRQCPESTQFVPALGDNAMRSAKMLEIMAQCSAERMSTVIHPSATISRHDVTIGAATFIGAGAIINPGVHIGMGVIINTGSIIEHDVSIGNWVHIAPGVDLAGAVKVENLALVGLGSRVLPGRVVGMEAIVGAGAVVTRDVTVGAIVRGSPAREC